MANIKQLPYFSLKSTKESNLIARFILKKIKRIIKKKMPYHYLIFYKYNFYLRFIKNNSKKYPYFLKFDIEKFYPSIDIKILINLLRKLLISKRGKILLTKITPFLLKNSISKKGLPLGNYLSTALSGLYLLPLDLKLLKSKKIFLKAHDDYLVFCKNKKEPLKILKEIVEPELNKLKLTLNIKKLQSGRFHQNEVRFLGFKYYNGIFTISEEKIEGFKKKIIKITHLNKKKDVKAIIKTLNNKIAGFRNYYQFSSSKEIFKDLDSFIRQRLRRYILKNKNQKNRLPNLVLTNKTLRDFGLKSLEDICKKKFYKKTLFFQNKRKISLESEKIFNKESFLKFNNYEKILIFSIFKELEKIAKNIELIKKKINNLEKKMEKRKD